MVLLARAASSEMPGRSPRRRLMLLALVAVMLAPGVAAAKQPPESFADLAEKLLPTVVNISTTQTNSREGERSGPDMPQFPPGTPFEEFFKDFFDRQQRGPDSAPRRATSLGSGFIIDASGVIVTNNHVIDGADEITVVLNDDTKLPAKLIGKDPKTDIAVLRVQPKAPLPAVAFGNSDVLRVGDWVVAIGNPFGLGGSVTAGIVSARQRDINAGPYDDFLQTDASINRGNSGGPLFNLNGDVVGINTAIYSPSGGSVGIGFAVPSALARPVVDQILKFGRTRRGWLGVRIQQVTDEIAETLGLSTATGALVASVSEDGPAAKAKIEAGDVILKFDGHVVDSMRKLPRMVAETSVDKPVDVVVWRKSKEVAVKVTLGELEEAEEAGLVEKEQKQAKPGEKDGADTVSTLGMSLATLDDRLRQQFRIGEDTKGVVVTKVEENGPAAQKGLRPGDVIVEVQQEEMRVPKDVAKRVEDLRKSGRKSALILIERGGELRYEAVRLTDKG